MQNAPSKTELQFQEEDRFPVNTVIVPQSMAASTKKTSVLSIAAKETDSPKLTKPGLDDFFAGRNRLYIWGEIQFSSERIGPHEPFVFCDYILVKDVLPNGTLQYHLCREGNPN